MLKYCSGQVATAVWAFVLTLPVQRGERFVVKGSSWLGVGEPKKIGKVRVVKDRKKTFLFDSALHKLKYWVFQTP